MKMVLKIKFKYKFLVLISVIVFPLIVFAQGHYDKIASVTIYSEYYPNPQARFQGTIIFENGSINTIEEWKRNKNFFNCVRQHSGIFMYDHNGLGKSPPDLSTSVKNPITAKLINNKLIALLQKQHIKQPYILVAHSYGGLYAGYFARKYPNLVKGVLLIDPSPYNSEFPDRVMAEIEPSTKLAQQISNKEMYDKYSYKNAIEHNMIPAEVVYHMLGFDQTKEQIKLLPPLSETIPIIILSSSWMEEHKVIKTGGWYEKQRQWLNSNPNSKIIKVPGGHFIHWEHPELVCEQIKVLVDLASCTTQNNTGNKVNNSVIPKKEIIKTGNQLKQINFLIFSKIDEAHKLSLGTGTKVAVLDWCFDMSKNTSAKYVNPISLVPNSPLGEPEVAHGSWMVDIVHQVAPKTKIIPIRVRPRILERNFQKILKNYKNTLLKVLYMQQIMGLWQLLTLQDQLKIPKSLLRL